MTERPTSQIRHHWHPVDCTTHTIHSYISNLGEGPRLILIAGWGSSGKSHLTHEYTQSYPSAQLRLDMAMPDRETRHRMKLKNGDDPKSMDFESVRNVVRTLVIDKKSIPDILYDHTTGRHRVVGTIYPSEVVVLDGALALSKELGLSEEFPTLRIFLDVRNPITRILMRHIVNTRERGYTQIQSLRAMRGYLAGYNQFIAPTKKYADLVFDVNIRHKFASPQITCS